MIATIDIKAELGAFCNASECQDKPGRSCELKGFHPVDYPFDKQPGERGGRRSLLSSVALPIAISICSLPGNQKGPRRNSARSQIPQRLLKTLLAIAFGSDQSYVVG